MAPAAEQVVGGTFRVWTRHRRVPRLFILEHFPKLALAESDFFLYDKGRTDALDRVFVVYLALMY